MASPDTHSFRNDILTDLLISVKNHRLAVASMVLLAVAATSAVTLTQPPVYEAGGSLFVRFGREYIYRSEVGQQSWSPFRANELIGSELEILNSRSLKERVVDELGPTVLYPELDASGEPATPLAQWVRTVRQQVKDTLLALLPAGMAERGGPVLDPALVRQDKAIANMEKSLSIKSPKDTNVIYIGFRHKDPELARQVIDRLIVAFLDQRFTIYGEERGKLMTEQSQRYQNALREAQEMLQSFKRSHGIANAQAEMDGLIRRESELTASMQSVQLEWAALQERLAALQRRDVSLSGGLAVSSLMDRDAIAGAMQQRLHLLLREQEALATSGPKSLAVQGMRQAQDGIRTYLEEQRQVEIGRVSLEVSFKAALLKGLQANRDATRAKLDGLVAYEAELATLQRNVDMLARNYEAVRQKADEAGIDAALDERRLMSIRVLQSPSARTRPVGLPKMVRIGIGGAMGLFFALLLAVYLERRAIRLRRRLPIPSGPDRGGEPVEIGAQRRYASVEAAR